MYAGAAGSASRSPSATSPATACDLGPRTPRITGGTMSGISVRTTPSQRTYRPFSGPGSPAMSRRSALAYSLISVRGLSGQDPTWRIQPGMPWPIPAMSRPGWSWARVASSIAAKATLRAPAGMIPIPTVRFSVEARTVAAWATPPRQPRSSTTQTWSNPSSSARRT